MTNNVMEEIVKFDTEKDEELINLFDSSTVQVCDLVDAIYSLLEEKQDLERKLEEEYEPKKIDPYEEYGISESDFH